MRESKSGEGCGEGEGKPVTPRREDMEPKAGAPGALAKLAGSGESRGNSPAPLSILSTNFTKR